MKNSSSVLRKEPYTRFGCRRTSPSHPGLRAEEEAPRPGPPRRPRTRAVLRWARCSSAAVEAALLRFFQSLPHGKHARPGTVCRSHGLHGGSSLCAGVYLCHPARLSVSGRLSVPTPGPDQLPVPASRLPDGPSGPAAAARLCLWVCCHPALSKDSRARRWLLVSAPRGQHVGDGGSRAVWKLDPLLEQGAGSEALALGDTPWTGLLPAQELGRHSGWTVGPPREGRHQKGGMAPLVPLTRGASRVCSGWVLALPRGARGAPPGATRSLEAEGSCRCISLRTSNSLRQRGCCGCSSSSKGTLQWSLGATEGSLPPTCLLHHATPESEFRATTRGPPHIPTAVPEVDLTGNQAPLWCPLTKAVRNLRRDLRNLESVCPAGPPVGEAAGRPGPSPRGALGPCARAGAHRPWALSGTAGTTSCRGAPVLVYSFSLGLVCFAGTPAPSIIHSSMYSELLGGGAQDTRLQVPSAPVPLSVKPGGGSASLVGWGEHRAQ